MQPNLVSAPAAHSSGLAERARAYADHPCARGARALPLHCPAARSHHAHHGRLRLVVCLAVVHLHAIRKPPLHNTCKPGTLSKTALLPLY